MERQYFGYTEDVTLAIAKEKEIKVWKREKRDGLIESMNPEWKDLSLDLLKQ